MLIMRFRTITNIQKIFKNSKLFSYMEIVGQAFFLKPKNWFFKNFISQNFWDVFVAKHK